MAVAIMVDNPQGSQKIYESVREQIGLEKPAGGIFHAAGPSPNGGWLVIEVWESEEGREAIRSGATAAGLQGGRRPIPASTSVLARAQLHGVEPDETKRRRGAGSARTGSPRDPCLVALGESRSGGYSHPRVGLITPIEGPNAPGWPQGPC